MEFKPNEITPERAKEVVLKFKEYGKGVVINEPSYTKSRDWDEFSLKWNDIINPDFCSIRQIKDKMLILFTKMRNLPEDKVLGDMSTAFSFTTDRGKRVSFTWEEMYIFCREAILERQETAAYKNKLEKAKKLKTFLEENTPKDTKVSNAQLEYNALVAELGLEETDANEKADAVPAS